MVSEGEPSQISNRNFAIFVLLFVGSCRDKPTPPDDGNHYIPSITLTAEDVGVTDAWLKVKFLDTTVNRKFKLVRDGETILTTPCSSLDTVILDENLLPKHTYRYIALRLVDTVVVDSALLTVPTMDTTSHNFTWAIDTLGDGNSSVLRDIAIINDTCAWAVGEIYKRDSTGQFETTPYNAARWNGKQWELIRIQFRLDYGTSVIYSYMRIKSLFAVSPDDIWFVHNVGGVTRFKNGQWVMMNFKLIDGPGGANKIWGTDPSNLYFVADLGKITHYNGTSWQKIESGTTLPIQDIWGAKNKITGEWEILAVASNKYLNEGKKFLRIIGNTVITLPDSGLPWSLSGIWFTPGRKYFIVGDGVYPGNNFIYTWQRDISFPAIYKNAIRGTGINNIAVSGSNGLVSHFNGVSWKHFINAELPYISGRYYSVSISEKILIAVGYIGNRAIIVKGIK